MVGTFWEVCQKSKEEDVLVNLTWESQNIINNGDDYFIWEDSREPVKLDGEFLRANWKIMSQVN